MAALHHQAQIQQALQPLGTPLQGPVFSHVDGAPLRPQWVLDQLRRRTEEIGLPKIGMHDLRQTLATTLNLYGHLLKYAAHDHWQ